MKYFKGHRVILYVFKICCIGENKLRHEKLSPRD
uniref:Uncharacterized protein n=1 Tax=Arundo donax TaxID=35708 RepID=A0A0A9AP22_ARUDO